MLVWKKAAHNKPNNQSIRCVKCPIYFLSKKFPAVIANQILLFKVWLRKKGGLNG